MKTLAIILLALGILMTVITSVNVVTHKKVVDIGPIDISKEEKTPIYWSPWAGIFLIAVGGSLLIYTRKKS
ncbi:hypothetical protein BH11BAC1_BH11BAC1_25430 [soil metagenome]